MATYSIQRLIWRKPRRGERIGPPVSVQLHFEAWNLAGLDTGDGRFGRHNESQQQRQEEPSGLWPQQKAPQWFRRVPSPIRIYSRALATSVWTLFFAFRLA